MCEMVNWGRAMHTDHMSSNHMYFLRISVDYIFVLLRELIVEF